MVGNYLTSQAEPKECCKCRNANWGTILVKTSEYWKQDDYICLECLLKKAECGKAICSIHDELVKRDMKIKELEKELEDEQRK